MSITGFADPEKLYKKSFHRRNDSGELDVFEAARYFSGGGGTDAAGAGIYNGSAFSQKITREERQAWRGGRISLDVPMMSNTLTQQYSYGVEKQIKEKKHKQPSSPGGRLASFLNSLFNQTASKKKKKSKSSAQSMKDHEEESPGGRRKRRSSISHFRSASTTDSKSIYSSSSSGFRTPPPYANTPTKAYKDLRSLSDHKQVVSLSKYTRFSNGASEKHKNFYSGFPGKDFDKFNIIDDGAESDSSSDLFELQNYDLGFYSSGLPVYETTHMDSIKRSATPISNGPI